MLLSYKHPDILGDVTGANTPNLNIATPGPTPNLAAKNGYGIYFCLWSTLHQYAKNYPTEVPTPNDRSDALYFFKAFKKAIPCTNPCQGHYEQWLQIHPLQEHLTNRLQLQHYVYDLHSDVNRRNNKTNPAFEEAMEIQDFISKMNLSQICATEREREREREREQQVIPYVKKVSSEVSSSPMSSLITSSHSWWPFGLFFLFGIAGGIVYCLTRPKKKAKKRNKYVNYSDEV